MAINDASPAPRIEDGHTRIANELLEAMCRAGFTSRQWSVVMSIARKTYGYQKKSDEIGLGQLAQMTGIDKAHLSRTVRELAEAKVIHRRTGTFGHALAINKRHTQWSLKKASGRVADSATVDDEIGLPKEQRGLPDQQPVNGVALLAVGVADSATVALSAKPPLLKEQPQKETIQKKEKLLSGKPDLDGEKLRLDDQSRAAIDHLNSVCETAYRYVESNLKLVRARLNEGATLDEIKRVIDAKALEWRGTDRAKYLRPETLFNATKFAQYIGLLGAPASSAGGDRIDLGGGRYRIGSRFYGADGRPEVSL